MKRPLLVLLLAVLAVVWIRILFFPGTLFFSYTKEQMHGTAEGDFLTVVGELQGAERKRTFDDTVVDVWYVRPLVSSRRHQREEALVQCIMEDGKTCQESGMQTEETCQEGGMQRGEMCPEEDREKESCPIGMIVKVRGKLRLFSGPTNPGEFDNRLYYSTMKIAYALKDCRILGASGRSAVIRKFLYHLRRRMDEVLTLCFSPEDGGIMKAVLLGEKSMMDSEIKDLYRRNGIIHVLAISGLHISLIGYLIYRLLCKTALPLPLCSACAILVMVLYGLMCGMNASAVRAIIMFLCRCAAPRLHRSYDLLSALSLSAILLLLDQPLWLKNGGFLFSFFAVGGIYFVMPALSFQKKSGQQEGRVIGGIRKSFRSSLAVSLSTLPVLLSFFYTVPVYSVFLNLMVIPLMTLLLVGGLIVIFLGNFSLLLGSRVALLDHGILQVYEKLCLAAQRLPWSRWSAGHAELWQNLLYLLCLSLFVFLYQKNTGRHPLKKAIELLRFVLLGVGLFLLFLRPRPVLKMTFVDVGQGDGIVLECKGNAYLIDGGSTSKKQVGKFQLLPFLAYEGIGEIKAAIVTHEDLDHFSGLLTLMEEGKEEGVRIHGLYLPDTAPRSRTGNYLLLEEKAKEAGIPVFFLHRGQEWKEREVDLRILGPPAGMETEGANAHSTILQVRWGSFSALFTGDVEKEGLEALKETLRLLPEKSRKVTLLKVPHHGSRYTSDEAFLSLCRPDYSVISCGAHNPYGHPHKETLKRLARISKYTWITKEDGAITVTLSEGGARMRVCTFLP